ncbi:hypothetical protein EMMF5_006594, partial [Cystobasidiomycetes sp. EMM_F5]
MQDGETLDGVPLKSKEEMLDLADILVEEPSQLHVDGRRLPSGIGFIGSRIGSRNIFYVFIPGVRPSNARLELVNLAGPAFFIGISLPLIGSCDLLPCTPNPQSGRLSLIDNDYSPRREPCPSSTEVALVTATSPIHTISESSSLPSSLVTVRSISSQAGLMTKGSWATNIHTHISIISTLLHEPTLPTGITPRQLPADAAFAVILPCLQEARLLQDFTTHARLAGAGYGESSHDGDARYDMELEG